MLTRRVFLRNSAAALALPSAASLMAAAEVRNRYHNPILAGDHPDASPIRVGNDFYLTHSSFDYAPGLLLWHSRDLVNWKPVAAALPRYSGGVWAPYLCEYEGRFYIYFPSNQRLHVVHADKPTGPWSQPVDLGIAAIDPAHIAENGRRFLYMNGGQMAELTPDGLAVKTPPRKVFDPWPMPTPPRMECTCLEAPKLLQHNGYFYLTVAEGGTAGPATSHSVVVARSRHADGPWEFSPHNPVERTTSRKDRWMSVGHGRLVDTPDGRWYMTVHSYENGYRTLGRQMLLLPIEWTGDGWFRVPPGIPPDAAIPVPIPGSTQQPFPNPSDDFTSPELGLQWAFWHDFDPARFATGNGAMTLQAKGDSLENTSALTTAVGGHSYTVEMDIEVTPGCASGLLLFYSPEHATGILLDDQGIGVRIANNFVPSRAHQGATRATFRVVNDDQEVDFYYRLPGDRWIRTEESAETSGMDHNVLGGFLDVRPAVFAAGKGHATFRSFRYWPEVKVPA
ncbi:MAG TPA: family 43 glycosylhydrolase [Terracidiphilus sp.]|jgi:beta-xylosidase|nr:family 43 glycosylhydrolase [Terracidiphilus sp.]